MRIIGVGSTNPVKINATKNAAEAYWDKYEIISASVQNGISDMPLSKAETRIGARNRAMAVLGKYECWIGVGHEGGVCWIDGDLYLFSTTYVCNHQLGNFGGETLMRLPSRIADGLDGTIELGSIIDNVTGKENVKQNEGAVGYLSKNVLTRTDIFELSTKMAFAHWVNSE